MTAQLPHAVWSEDDVADSPLFATNEFRMHCHKVRDACRGAAAI